LNFSDFGFDSDLMEGIEAMGFKSPTPIQEQAIPAILQGNDIIGAAAEARSKYMRSVSFSYLWNECIKFT